MRTVLQDGYYAGLVSFPSFWQHASPSVMTYIG